MTAAEQIAAALGSDDIQRDHKRAFRVAFDLLNRNWPPENTVEYWVKAGGDFNAEYMKVEDSRLAAKLIDAVYAYLEDVSKDASKHGQAEGSAAV